MRVCPQCGFRDDPRWKPLFWQIYWEYAPLEDFKEIIPNQYEKKRCEAGNFYYHFEDDLYYYRLTGKTRRIIRRLAKGYESSVNRKLYEKTPSEKGFQDKHQKKLIKYIEL